jgi:endonuclease III-like uncharacterized protein
MRGALAVENTSEPEQLANYIRSLAGFERYTPGGSYGHVGATLANAVLQSNNNYERNVQPRVERIREEYARETSLRDIKRLLGKITAQEFLHWNGTRKAKTFNDLVKLLSQEGVNTEDDLRQWLQRDDSKAKLLKIHFIGQKTVDYLKILVGLDEEAMDRHLLGFLERAGLGKLNYERGKEVIHRTADLMGWKRAHLDHSIWRYMSGGKQSRLGSTTE